MPQKILLTSSYVSHFDKNHFSFLHLVIFCAVCPLCMKTTKRIWLKAKVLAGDNGILMAKYITIQYILTCTAQPS